MFIVGATPEHDAADVAASIPARSLDHRHAILSAIEPLDLPDVGLDTRFLQLPDGLDHEHRTHLAVIGASVSTHVIELRRLRRHQQLEHELAIPLAEVFGEAPEASGLTRVERGVAAGVVPHEHLAERRVDRLDVRGELRAVLEVELVLSALLRRSRGDVTAPGGVAQDGGAKLLVDQDGRSILRDPAGDSGPEARVDHLLGGGNLGRLRRAQRHLPAEQALLERGPVVEGQHVERVDIAETHDDSLRNAWNRLMSASVE